MTHGSRYRTKRTRRKIRKNVTQVESASPPPQTIIIRYVTTSTQTEMTEVKKKSIPDLQSINRITNFPIVETGLNYAEDVYNKIKKSNSVFNFAFEQAENTIHTVVDSAAPAFILLQGPINSVDKLVCKSLDFVEDKVPSINLPPQMIYWNTKEYAKETVSTKIVRPVLKRADSVKQIGNTVLSSKYTAYAAETLDGALNVADKYVDKYLPAADDDQYVDEPDNNERDGPAGKAIHTIHHADRLGRKLKRRLTKRTLAEVKALKEHSAEAVHVLIYVAELIATDPKLAYQKGKELWASLSEDEPENQARPENLEQLVVLLTRETSRRLVHLINYSGALVSRVPKRVTHSAVNLVNKFFGTVEQMIKTVHMENAQKSLVKSVKSKAYDAAVLLKQLNVRFTDFLVSYILGMRLNYSADVDTLSDDKTKIDIRMKLEYRFVAVFSDDWKELVQLKQSVIISYHDTTDTLKPSLKIFGEIYCQHNLPTITTRILYANEHKYSIAQEQLAQKLDEQETSINVLSVPRIKVEQLKAFHTNSMQNRNGVESNSTNSS